MIVRDAQPADAPFLAKLLAQLGYPASPEECQTRIDQYKQDRYQLWMGEEGDEIIAFIALHHYNALHHSKPIGRVVAFCVDEKYRSTGLGSELLQRAEIYFQEKGCFKVELTSNLRRQESHDYYRKRGYHQSSLHLIKLLN